MKSLPHFLLISGNGQNVGKTTLTTELIRQHSEVSEVMTIKVSPHRHTLPAETEFISQSPHFEIVRETLINQKDSSRFLQAGANPSIYIQCTDEYLEAAITEILPLTSGKAVVCESGGLAGIFIPGISIYLYDVSKKNLKSLSHQPDFIIPSQNGMFEFPHQRIQFDKGKWISS